MAGDIKVKELKVRGFRGFGDREVPFDLAYPVVLLGGNNRSGKSSTLNAIEWALYGSAVTAGTGIEERANWLVCNLGCEKARVELTLTTDNGDIKVTRELTGKRKKGAGFSFVDEQGRVGVDEAELHKLLGMDAKGFMSSVYLHQEVIRDILTTTPGTRRKALDRLLGVDELRALYEGLKGFKAKGYQEEVDNTYSRLEALVETQARAQRQEIDRAKAKGAGMGLDEGAYSEAGFKRLCEEGLSRLKSLADKAGMGDVGFAVPESSQAFPEFSRQVAAAVEQLRSRNPGAVSQREIIGRRDALNNAQAEYNSKAGRRSDLLNRKRQLEEEGTLEARRKKLDELQAQEEGLKQEMKALDARSGVVAETIEFLEGLEGQAAAVPCPACEQQIQPQEVLGRLRSTQQNMESSASDLNQRLDEAKGAIRQARNGIKELEDLVQRDLSEAEDALRKAEEVLRGLFKETPAADADLNVCIDREMTGIEAELKAASEVLDEYNRGIANVVAGMGGAEVVAEVLSREARISGIEAISASDEWKGLDGSRDAISEELEAVDLVQNAVLEVLNEVSREKLAEAESRIVEYYRELVERSDFDGITIDPDSNYDVCAVSGDKRVKALTFFNQGDMNCAAMSIFLALGGGARGEGPAFLMIDDPSQSLDSGQKGRLARLLDRVSEGSQVILATMDDELLSMLKSAITRNKKVYRLGAWSPQSGPVVEEE